MNKLTVKLSLEISDSEIDDLMVTALEGGINYWCGSATIKRNADGSIEGVDPESEVKYASDVISQGGTLILEDVEEPEEKWELNKEKFLEGLASAIEWAEVGSVESFIDGHDADWIDVLIQNALFKTIVFG